MEPKKQEEDTKNAQQSPSTTQKDSTKDSDSPQKSDNVKKPTRVKDPEDAVDKQHAEQHETPFAHLSLRERISANCGKLISKRKDIIERLKVMKQAVEKHFASTRRTKTTSTISSVIGTTLLFTPLAPVGLGFLGLGAAGGVGSTVNDYFKSKGYNKGVGDILKEETSFAQELQDDLNMVMEAANKLSEETGCPQEEAVSKVVNGLKTGKLNLTVGAMNCSTKWKEFKQGLDFIGKVDSGSNGIGLAAKATSAAITSTFSIIGSAAIDVLDCVNSWQSNHPSIDTIDRSIKDLEAGIRELELMKIIFS